MANSHTMEEAAVRSQEMSSFEETENPRSIPDSEGSNMWRPWRARISNTKNKIKS